MEGLKYYIIDERIRRVIKLGFIGKFDFLNVLDNLVEI